MKNNKVYKFVFSVLAFCLLVSIVVLGCTQPTTTPQTAPTPAKSLQPQYGGTFRYSEPYDAASMGDPAKIGRTRYTMQAVSPVVETLFRLDAAGNIVPWLVSEYKLDSGTKTYTLALKKGIKFHDGTDFNAAAVKWNLQNHISAKASGTDNIKSVDIIDDNNLRLNLNQWETLTLTELAWKLGFMISPTSAQKNGMAWAADNPIGTGPFQFVSWQKDVKIVLKKWDGYWQKGKPYLDQIVITPIVDDVTRALSMRNHELDLIEATALSIADLEKAGFTTIRYVGVESRCAFPDSANAKSPWADVKVRQAAQHAIDSAMIVKSILYGQYQVSNQLVSTIYWGYNPNIAGYAYNPAKSKQLLTEAGYPNGFKTKLTYRPDDPPMFEAIQGYLKTVGIDAELNKVLSPAWDTAVLKGGGWEGLISGSFGGYPDIVSGMYFRFSGLPNYSVSVVYPDDYKQAVQNARIAGDFETKKKFTQEAGRLMIDKYCLILPVFSYGTLYVVDPSVHNHNFSATQQQIWTPEDCWIEKR